MYEAEIVYLMTKNKKITIIGQEKKIKQRLLKIMKIFQDFIG